MKVDARYLGKFVEIQWCDPNSSRVSVAAMPKGRPALAMWREYGIFHDITDNVVILVHSAASLPGRKPDEIDEVECTAIHAALIEKITVYRAA
jgi:hypothetical protein